MSLFNQDEFQIWRDLGEKAIRACSFWSISTIHFIFSCRSNCSCTSSGSSRTHEMYLAPSCGKIMLN